MRRTKVILVAVFLTVFSAVMLATGVDTLRSGEGGRNVNGRDDYQRKYIDMRKYQAMDDPKKAAVLLLEEAREKGLDVNEIKDPDPRTGDLSLPFGYLPVEDGDRSFVDGVKARYRGGGGEADTMCLIQVNRRTSIQEKADFFMLGIKIYKHLAVYGYIARVPIDQVETVSNLPFVRWIGAHKASYKYKQDFPYQNDKIFAIHTWIEDEIEGRTDLEKLGLKVTKYGYGVYFVEMAKEDLPRVTQLWWVEWITQSRIPTHNTVPQTRNDKADKGPASHYVDFRPQDSRKLVSAIRNYMSLGGSQVWDGGSEIIGIRDNGCYWSYHDELKDKDSNTDFIINSRDWRPDVAISP